MHTVKCMWCILRTKAAVKFPMHQEQVLHPTFHFELKCDVQAMLAQCLWSSLSGNCWLHGEEKPLFIFRLFFYGLGKRRKLKGYMGKFLNRGCRHIWPRLFGLLAASLHGRASCCFVLNTEVSRGVTTALVSILISLLIHMLQILLLHWLAAKMGLLLLRVSASAVCR